MKGKKIFAITLITILAFVLATVFFVVRMLTNERIYMILCFVSIICGCGLNVVISFLGHKTNKRDNDKKE